MKAIQDIPSYGYMTLRNHYNPLSVRAMVTKFVNGIDKKHQIRLD